MPHSRCPKLHPKPTVALFWGVRSRGAGKTHSASISRFQLGGITVCRHPDDIVGTWLNQDKDAKIEIFKCGNEYCGKIIWLKDPTYPTGSKEGTPGTPKIDSKNPDAAHRKDPLMGLQIVQGLQYSGDNQWKNGKIYDPDSGKTYSSKATLASHDELDLRGFIGISLIGRTEKWTRAK